MAPIPISTRGRITGKKQSKTGGLCLSSTNASSTSAGGKFFPLVINFIQKYAASAPGIANTIPNNTNLPIFTCRIPAAASAPGCVGTRQCTANKALPNMVAMLTRETLELALKDLASPLKIIKPESQKMVRPATNPVVPRAAAACFCPVLDKINVAIITAAPVLSSIMPITDPNMIRKPVAAMVFPKPSFKICTISLPGSARTASNKETMKSERKAFAFHLEVSKIIATMDPVTRKASVVVSMVRQGKKLICKI